MMYVAMFLNNVYVFGREIALLPSFFWEEKEHEEQSVGRRGVWMCRTVRGHCVSREKKETHTKINKDIPATGDSFRLLMEN